MNKSVALRSFAFTSMIWRIIRICDVVNHFFRKSFWFFLRIFSISGSIMISYVNTKVKVSSNEEDRLIWYCCWGSANGYNCCMLVQRLYTSNDDRSNQRKRLYTNKGKKQTIPRRKYESGISSKRHWSPRKCRQNEVSFSQVGDISTLNGGSLKLVDKFSYLGGCLSYIESGINMCLARAWIAIYRLSIPGSSCVSPTEWMHHMDAE